MMNPFEIFIAYLTWGSGGKYRPILALIVGGNSVDMFRITTQFENKSVFIQAHYFEINDWAQAGLDKQSYVDTGTLITLPLNTFKDRTPIGKLTKNDRCRLLEFLTNTEEP